MSITAANDWHDPAVSVRDLLANATRDFCSGNLAGAEHLYREIVEDYPDQPEAWFLLGLIALKAGDEARALAAVERAIALRPARALYHLYAGDLYRTAGRLDDAVAAFHTALFLEPRSARALCSLTLVELARGHVEAGLAAFRQALAATVRLDARALARRCALAFAPVRALGRWLLHPQQPLPVLIDTYRASLHARYGDPSRALQAARRAVDRAPGLVPARVGLGEALRQTGAYTAAATEFVRAMDVAPFDPTVAIAASRALRAVGDHRRAIRVLEALFPTQQTSVAVQCALGWARYGSKDANAVRPFEVALAHDPEDVDARYGLARCLRVTGRVDEAEDALRQVLAVRPDHAFAYKTLAESGRLAPNDALFARLVRLAGGQRGSQFERATYNFAAAHAYEHAGDASAAWAHYVRGNDLRDVTYARTAWTRHVDALVATYDSDFFAANAERGDASEQPVFVIGMPRAGTDLVGHLLAGHPDVSRAGDLEALDQLVKHLPETPGVDGAYPECIGTLDGHVGRRLAVDYLARLRDYGAATRFIVDTMPENFLHLGLIATLFPNARIVHCRRDPLETCVLLYCRSFARERPYAYALDNVAHYYREYERLMAHWHRVLPDRILEVDHATLLADPESETHRLLAHCGLRRTEPGALAAAGGPPPPVRRSALQDGAGLVAAYDAYLEPLKDTLAG